MTRLTILLALVAVLVTALALPALAWHATGYGDCHGWYVTNPEAGWNSDDYEMLVSTRLGAATVAYSESAYFAEPWDIDAQAGSLYVEATWLDENGRTRDTWRGTITRSVTCETTTTTTVPPSTTTTVPPTTSTTKPNICDESHPLWNPDTQDCRLPFTGGEVSGGTLVFFGVLGSLLLLVGAAGVAVVRRR